MPTDWNPILAGGQVVVAVATLILAAIAIWQLRHLKVMRRIDIVARDRSEWIHLADAMIQFPQLVRVYANRTARAALAEKTTDELREFAFVNRALELVSFNYYLCQHRGINREIGKLYPEGIEFTSERMYQIWHEWGLKEDYNTELQQFIEKQVFKR